MGNLESLLAPPRADDTKLQNGAANGHVTISSSDEGESVAGEAAAKQSSESPCPPKKDGSPPSGNQASGIQPMMKVTFFSAPKGPSQQPVSVEGEASLQSSKPAPESSTVIDSPPKEEEPNEKESKTAKFFGKVLIKKKSPPEDPNPPVEAQVVTNGLHSEPGDVKGSATEEKGPSPNGIPAGGVAVEVDGKAACQVDTKEQEAPEEEPKVMSFFKSLVAPSKAPKEEVAPPAPPLEEVKVSEELEVKAQADTSPETQPADPSMEESKAMKISVNPFGMFFKQKPPAKDAKPEPSTKAALEVDASVAPTAPKSSPPPPPAEPTKLEVKVEPTVNSAPKEAPKDAVQEPEDASTQKPAKSNHFRKLFQLKTTTDLLQSVLVPKEEEEEPQPVEEEKAKSADVKASPAQSPKAEKKSGKTSLISLFKPVSLLVTKEEVKEVEEEPQPVEEEKAKSADVKASPAQSPKAEKKSGKTSLISLFKPVSIDIKTKESTSVAAPAVTTDTAQAASVKVEVKPAAEEEKKPVKQEAAPVAEKPVSEATPAGEDSKKLDKKNSMHSFFKSLNPKRQCDTGVQTEPVTIVDAAK